MKVRRAAGDRTAIRSGDSDNDRRGKSRGWFTEARPGESILIVKRREI